MSAPQGVGQAQNAAARPSRATAEIETGAVVGLTHEGEGIVRNGKAAFVAGALPGETIRFRRLRRHRQHDDAVLVEILVPAPQRVAPRCAHFTVCGGCALQHLEPEAQLQAKEAQLRDNLERLAGVTPRIWLAPLRGPVWGYRRKARLGARFVAKKGRVVVGFRERLSSYVADTTRCEVLAPPVGSLLEPLSALLTSLSIRERVPQIEVAVADNATALVLRVLAAPSERDLDALRRFEQAHGVRLYLQPRGLESVTRLLAAADSGTAGESSPPSATEPALHYGLPGFGLELEFVPSDFVQINGPANQALVERAVTLLDPTPHSRVLDLYCGLGNFTLALARRAGQVLGVEGEPGLVERARHNARINGIENAEFHVANLAEPFSSPAGWLARGFTHVLLDPPRAGALETLPLIARLAPQRVLYISCHPGSLARDLRMLVHDHGFVLRAAGVLDMFPHTNHVESIAVLEAPGAVQAQAT